MTAGIVPTASVAALAHDRISIYRFADGASSEQRAKTMQRMIDDIGGYAHHAMAIRLHGVDSKEEIALASTASDE